MIVLDTDAISGLMRSRPAATLVKHLEDVPLAEQATTAITLGEIAYGARRVGRSVLYDRALRLLAGVRILDFDRVAAEQYGIVRTALEVSGRRLADPDLRIASIVLAHRGTLLTGNVRHFGRVPGLQVVDWQGA